LLHSDFETFPTPGDKRLLAPSPERPLFSLSKKKFAILFVVGVRCVPLTLAGGTRNPKERDLDHIPRLSKSIGWLLHGIPPGAPRLLPCVKSPGLLLPGPGLFIS